MNTYPAHIRSANGAVASREQTVREHCEKSAEYAQNCLSRVGLGQTAYLAGLTHDAGKYTRVFEEYLRSDGAAARGSVIHTFAAVKLLLERYHSGDGSVRDAVCELLAVAVGSHHGLFDCVDENRKNGFEHRISKQYDGCSEAIPNYFALCCGEARLDELFESALAELAPIIERINELPSGEETNVETMFYAGLLSRLLLSSVIEGDRRDTAEFMRDVQFPPRRGEEQLRDMWSGRLAYLEAGIDRFKADTPINKARGEISRRCRDFAEHKGGVIRLNLPTGAGKTLSVLRFALAHAKKYAKERIVYVAPLLSIIEQNAGVIREYIGNDDIILEHHSNIVQPEQDEQLDMRELLCDTWDSPIIITTMVQLFNTLYDGATTSIRRMHSLCGSVIIIDEVQSVPDYLLSLFTLAVNFLCEVMDATVVLCSATQPCMERLPHPLRGPVSDMVPYDEALWSVFRRTEIKPLGSMTLSQLADFARGVLLESDSLLIVCNKKDEARELFHQLRDFGGRCFHLSASMCMAHRKRVLRNLLTSLDAHDGVKTLCVSTQVIEAGIDISFERALRLLAGMDSVIQTFGRCNRNAEAGTGVVSPVYVVECTGEKLGKLQSIQSGKDASAALLCEFARDPEHFESRLDSEAAIEFFYRTLYRRMAVGPVDFPIPKKDCTLLDLLSCNYRFATEELPDSERYCLRQAFRLASSLFNVFERGATDVIVPCGESDKLIQELGSSKAKYDILYQKKLLDEAKEYCVSLYKYELDALQREGAIYTECGAMILKGHYDPDTGFSIDNNKLEFEEV